MGGQKEPLYVLVIEDTETDFRLFHDLLGGYEAETDWFDFRLEWSRTLKDGLRLMEADPKYDVILLDLQLPDASYLEGLQQLKKTWPESLVVILSGVNDPDLARQAITEGAEDFLVKDQISRQRIVNALEFALVRGRRVGSLYPPSIGPEETVDRCELMLQLERSRKGRQAAARTICERRKNGRS